MFGPEEGANQISECGAGMPNLVRRHHMHSIYCRLGTGSSSLETQTKGLGKGYLISGIGLQHSRAIARLCFKKCIYHRNISIAFLTLDILCAAVMTPL